MSEVKKVPVIFPIELCTTVCKYCENEFALFKVFRPSEEYMKEEPDAKPQLWMMEPNNFHCPHCGKDLRDD
jgi:hypothetical protein